MAQQPRFQSCPFQPQYLHPPYLRNLLPFEVVAVGVDALVRNAASASAVSSLKLFFLNPCVFLFVDGGQGLSFALVALQKGRQRPDS